MKIIFTLHQLKKIKVNDLPLMNFVQMRPFSIGLTTARVTHIKTVIGSD